MCYSKSTSTPHSNIAQHWLASCPLCWIYWPSIPYARSEPADPTFKHRAPFPQNGLQAKSGFEICFDIGSQHVGCWCENTSPHAQGCDLSCTVSHIINHDRPLTALGVYMESRIKKFTPHWVFAGHRNLIWFAAPYNVYGVKYTGPVSLTPHCVCRPSHIRAVDAAPRYRRLHRRHRSPRGLPSTAPLSPHTPKAVAYNEPTVMWLFMIGHTLGRMDIPYFLATFPFIWGSFASHVCSSIHVP